MSRSNPTENTAHPCSRWFEWDGANGLIRYYDKTEKKNVEVGDKFTFILLDRLCVVKGWSDASDSGIYSNEVKDTRAETLVVKSFKGGIIAEGFYAQIKDKVNAAGGNFTINCYVAFVNETKELVIGSLQLKGAALSALMDFEKKHRADLYKKAVKMDGFTEGKKGKVIFRTPKFFIKEVSEETDAKAKVLDEQLQTFLKSYFTRTRVDQVAQTAKHEEPEREVEYEEEPPIDHTPKHVENDEASDSDIPF